jgi:hypothetical protein
MTHTPENTFLHIARTRLVVHLTGQVRTYLDALDGSQIWWRPNPASNAVGNLVLHCAGSTRYYLGHVVGGHEFVRDRDAEFTARDVSKNELRERLDAAASEADQVLEAFDPARLLEITDRTPKPTTFMQVIGLQLVHYATHVGQIAYVAKTFAPTAINDVWRNTPSH